MVLTTILPSGTWPTGAREVLDGINPPKYDWKYVIDWTPQFRQKMFESFL